MRRSIRGALGLVAVLSSLFAGGPIAAQTNPMTIVDLIEVPSLGDVQLSPDGEQVLFVRGDANWDANKTIRHVWRASVAGGDPIQLTNGAAGESSPRWSPDGAWIAFVAERGDEGADPDHQAAAQIHLLNATGGEARSLTEHPTATQSVQWSPDGDWIYFLANDEKTEAQKATFVGGSRGFDGLLVIKPDGKMYIQTGVGNLGTGNYSDSQRVAAEMIGVPWEKVVVTWGGTNKNLPWSCASGGSQTTHATTRAAHAAATDAIASASRQAAPAKFPTVPLIRFIVIPRHS